MPHFNVFIGSYASAPDHGISLASFNNETGALENLGVLATAPNPSFLAIDASGKFIYAIHDRNPGQVAAYRYDDAERKLQLLNTGDTLSPGPTHLCLDKDRQNLIVANYAGGSVSVFTILSDGSLGECSCVVQHAGQGPDAKRQDGPHAHGVYLSPDGKFILCVDLGVDKIYIYRLEKHRLIPHTPPFAEVKSGAGARHGAFSPDGSKFYVINELDNTITAFAWDAEAGSLTAMESYPTLPEGFAGANLTAEIEFHPNGKFLYGSNRGHDSIVRYAVKEVGSLTLLGHTMIGASEPRHFHIHPGGKWLLTGNQKASSMTLFAIDEATGDLTPHGAPCAVNQPVCVLFKAAPKVKPIKNA
jgi:6-phosphogluconolactonase